MSGVGIGVRKDAQPEELMTVASTIRRAEGAAVARRLAGAFACDWAVLSLLAIYAALIAPLVPRSTANPQHLATFNDDDPVITQQLVGMTVPPYGNPANYLRHPERRPAYWGTLAWPGQVYYGGTYLDAAFVLVAPLKLLGCADFPAAPICLRLVSLAAGAMCLVVIYNLGRRLGGRWTGAGAGVLLILNPWFVIYSATIHPDILMTALAMFALWVAVLHVEHGDWISLTAFALLVGLVHGAKAVGPWLVPLGVVAVVWAEWRRLSPDRPRWSILARRFIALGLLALVGFAASTPYAFIDSYFFRALRYVYRYNLSRPFGDHPFSAWLAGLWQYQSPIMQALTGLGIFLGCMRCFGSFARRRQLPMAGATAQPLPLGTAGPPMIAVLATVVAASVFFWYASTVRLFVNLNYLLTYFALAGLLLAYGVGQVLQPLHERRGTWSIAASSMAGVLLLAIVGARANAPLRFVLNEYCREQTTFVAMGRWAEQNLPHDAKIVYYGHCYFDPVVFPNACWGSNGLVVHRQIEESKPDYFVLDASAYNAPHIAALRKTQHYVRDHEGGDPVLFLQEVLDRGSPEAELVAIVGPSGASRGPQALGLLATAWLAFGLDDRPVGPEVRLYRYHPERRP
jgi:hypothetical protein